MRRRAREGAIARGPSLPQARAMARVELLFADRAVATVQASPELERIARLPRASGALDPEAIDLLTDHLKTAGGAQSLRPIQAAALVAVADSPGVLVSAPVGFGKTLITILAPVVTGAARPLLIVPAKLRDKTRRDISAARLHWRAPEIEIVSYEKLGRVSGADYLATLAPDLIMADECHRLKNPRAAVTRRVLRYCAEASPRAVFLSGTITGRSLLDFHHLIRLTHGPEACPLPWTHAEAATWAAAVDEGVEARTLPGPLVVFSSGGSGLSEVREGVGRRIRDTAGVVSATGQGIDASIQISTFDPDTSDEVRRELDHVIKGKRNPDGSEASPSDIHRHARTLVQGFFYQWDPEPPDHWRRARSAWARFVREILEEEDPRYDSELQIARACEADRLPSHEWARWTEVRGDYDGKTIPVWLSDQPLISAALRVTHPAIVWVEHIATGRKLHEITGWPYFHRLGISDDGRRIDDADGTAPIIASIAANGEGRNLQAFHRNLVITPPGSGKTWEQLIGRTHRHGQIADEVEIEIMIGHPSIARTLDQARKDAAYIGSITGSPQKLEIADMVSAPGPGRA